MAYVSARKASELLDYTPDHLRRLANAGKIDTIRTEGGHRRYDVDGYIKSKSDSTLITICYCRVSSTKQRDDLERQVNYMRSIYPKAEIIRDIGSGLNFKRKGIRALLERLMQGDKLQVVIAHRDRLARFGIDLIRYLIEQNGGELVVLDQTEHSPQEELTEDLLAILHVFSCRMHGLRSYSQKIKEDKSLSNI
ncbi:IS607 family transposase [Candidatus Poribacteria bacterium]|nr:IS607 family transposase [Candidatus Poribacteria bacterium]